MAFSTNAPQAAIQGFSVGKLNFELNIGNVYSEYGGLYSGIGPTNGLTTIFKIYGNVTIKAINLLTQYGPPVDLVGVQIQIHHHYGKEKQLEMQK